MVENALLRRLVHPAPAVQKEEAPHIRTMRRVISQAGELALGVPLAILEVHEHVMPPADFLERLPVDGLIQTFERHGKTETVWAYDRNCVEACVEAQTKGFVSSQGAVDRATTAIDRSLTNALAEYVIPMIAMEEGLPPVMDLGAVFETPQALLLNLPPRALPIMELRLDFGKGIRSGSAFIISVVPPVARLSAPEGKGWAAALDHAVNTSHVTLDATLFETRMSWSALKNLSVGSTLMIPRKALETLTLVGCNGKTVARAKLGQIGGMKAARLVDEPSEARGVPEFAGSGGVAGAAPSGTNFALALPRIEASAPEMPKMPAMPDLDTAGLPPLAGGLPPLGEGGLPPLAGGLPPLGEGGLPPLAGGLPPLGEGGLPPLDGL